MNAGKHSSGQVFEIDSNPIPTGNETNPFGDGEKNFFQVFLAVFS
jgi:hypothetical protein